MDLSTFIQNYDACTQIDDVEFDALVAAHGRKLVAANQSVYLPIEEAVPLEGALELRFDDNKILQFTMGHWGTRVYTEPIYPDPENPDVPTEVQPLAEAEYAIGKTCRDILVGLEEFNASGHKFLAAAFALDFGSIRIGYENFSSTAEWPAWIVLNPSWPNCRLVSLITGKTYL
ncbi:MAG: hypothetical protein AAF085_05185 [Planctomycetota bacterium]